MVEFTGEAIWPWTFLSWEILITDSVSYSLLICSDFPVFHGSFLVNYMFLGIYPFLRKIFFLGACKILFLCLFSESFVIMCLGEDYSGLKLLGHPLTSWTWMTKSLPMFGMLSGTGFSLCDSNGTHIILMVNHSLSTGISGGQNLAEDPDSYDGHRILH